MRKKKSVFTRIIVFLLLAIILLGTAYYFYDTYQSIDLSTEYKTAKLNTSVTESTSENNIKTSNNIVDILENISRCVVGISKIETHSNSIFSNNSVTELGLGTGVIVSSNGYILSNCHVTGEKLSTCYVTLENGYTYDGTVVWSDAEMDLSITKINANNLEYAIIGDSSKVKSGETVYAIGNPIGYEFRRTITSGIISAINRTIKIEENGTTTYMTDLIQTDASINQGNSGGPLLLSTGEIIGINSVKITTAEGIGFAIPVNAVKPIIEKFISTNSFDEPYLGIYAYDQEVIPYILPSANNPEGIYIVHINKDSPVKSTEIQVGDILKSIDGKTISNMIELREYIYSKNVGDTITLEITRGYVTRNYQIVLGRKK